MTNKKEKQFVDKRIATNICYEQAAAENPYQTDKLYLAGYDLEEVATNGSFIDVLFLMYTGDKAISSDDYKLLESLMILLSLPSPRHPASRAAINSGICKTNAEHLLPISLMALGGTNKGAQEVSKCYQFISQNIDKDVQQILAKADFKEQDSDGIPGFGKIYGDIDPLSSGFLKRLAAIKPNSLALKWALQMQSALAIEKQGILDVGIAACVFYELSFGVRESAGLYQYLRSPGLLAYAMEQTHKPVSAIPMLEDSQYELINPEK